MKKISVIMSIYNETVEELKRSIESILNQSYPVNEFIIVVDNPNNQDNIELVEKYRAKNECIHVIINKKNEGLVFSLNEALKFSSGTYVARMDADDEAMIDRMENELNYLEENGLDLVSGFTRRVDEDGNLLSVGKIRKIYNINEQLLYDNFFPHPCWFGKKEVFDKLEGYRKIPYCEDYDFLLRAIVFGFKLGMCENIVLNYTYRVNSISRQNGLKQLLISTYLSKNYKRIASVTVDEVLKVIEPIREKDEIQYKCALKYHIKAARNKGIRSFWNIIRAILCSRYYWINIKKMIFRRTAKYR